MTPTLLSYWLNGILARYLRKRAEINEKQGFYLFTKIIPKVLKQLLN